jgi:hypothetical protein
MADRSRPVIRGISDRPIPYTPVCGRDGAVPVCVHPAYHVYLANVMEGVEPALRAVAGLPGAPTRVEQTAASALTLRNNTAVSWAAGSSITGTPATFRFPIGLFPPGLGGAEQLAGTVQESLIVAFVNDGRLLTPGTLPAAGILAQEAVEWVLLQPFDPSAEQDVAPSGPDSQTASPMTAGRTMASQACSSGSADWTRFRGSTRRSTVFILRRSQWVSATTRATSATATIVTVTSLSLPGRW